MPTAVQPEQIVRTVAGWRLVLQATRDIVFRWKVYGFQGESTVMARGFDKADALKSCCGKAELNIDEVMTAFEIGEGQR